MSKRNTARKSKSVPPAAPAPVLVSPPVEKVVATSAAKTVVNASPRHEDIARRAYELYLQRGARHGCDLQDWIVAERELTAA